jgi:hypothetical protein
MPMEERHRVRLGQILWRSRLGEWDRKGLEERCVGWWPSLAAFVAEQLSGTKAPPPAELVGVLEAVGQSWMAEVTRAVETFSSSPVGGPIG